ncbi:hypothetical protein CWR43_36215 [Rhizobium sullae]|uniref:Uncharacterized protein n=1 Tax=Rhizobium sullae TaxID=50338 RepID=A0A2N0CY63_RHISU|nr:hypothetical protein [Rhizobium sullae]PKA38796.1 hypothetical protein CWR43_36215 [Rhizobium sullae]
MSLLRLLISENISTSEKGRLTSHAAERRRGQASALHEPVAHGQKLTEAIHVRQPLLIHQKLHWTANPAATNARTKRIGRALWLASSSRCRTAATRPVSDGNERTPSSRSAAWARNLVANSAYEKLGPSGIAAEGGGCGGRKGYL